MAIAPYQSIIVGVDFSAGSLAALKVAADLAKKSQAALRVYHFVYFEIAEEHRRAWQSSLTKVEDVANQDLGRFVERALGSSKGLQIHAEARLGHRFVELVKAIEEHHADLLVLGTHGRHHSNSQAPGLLATKCVRKAPCEVMLVEDEATLPFKQILAAVDYSDNSALALTEAIQIGNLTGAKVQVVHVSQPPWLFLMHEGLVDVDVTDDAKAAYHRQQETDMKAFLQGLGLDDTLDFSIIERPETVAGLIECQKQTNADLIVLGNSGQTPTRLVLFGSFAERVVRDSPCSILTIKPAGHIQHTAMLTQTVA